MISNKRFLQAIFGLEYGKVHVTSFLDDPSNIAQDRRAICWGGHHYSERELCEGNQYFTVSLFNEKRRKKDLFNAMYIVMLDDVREKLDFEAAQRLPTPSYILETSHGSEQWGYILSTPCTSIDEADNLSDGLISRGLAPNGKDPGMKGVTRYVRLPEGHNSKRSKLVFGRPFQSRLLSWNPELKYVMADLAKPFDIDLNAERRQVKLSGATKNDHPLLDKLDVKEDNGNGQYQITCPWLDEHTAKDNSGTAFWTNLDGSVGFKCHHGHCESRTAFDLIQHFDIDHTINEWKVGHTIEQVKTLDDLLAELDHTPHGVERNRAAEKIIIESKSLPAIDQIEVGKKVKDIMDWNTHDMKKVSDSLKAEKKEQEFFNNYVFIAEQNKFYHPVKHMWYTTEAFTNLHYSEDVEAKKSALSGKVEKADKIDYAPELPEFFNEDGMRYCNIWRPMNIVHKQGDIQPWLNHFSLLGWDPEHVLDWMAFTLRHPAQKINHAIILGSGEGSGKDWILTPLKMAMGSNHQTIDGEELLKEYNDYIKGTKYLHINEIELGDNKDALRISNKIKPLTAAPPDKLRLREMYAGSYDVRNIVNCTMATNSRLPLRLRDMSRRIYALWSDFTVRDHDGIVEDRWVEYWDKNWSWMNNGGWQYCVDHLMSRDISHFNPGKAPPVTTWLREIVQNSENTITQTLKSLIAGQFGTMGADRVSTQSIIQAFRFAQRTSPEFVHCDRISPGAVTLNMQNLGYKQKDGLWHIRNEGVDKVANLRLI